MIKGIVFDLDGTLVDSLTPTFEAFNHGFTSQGGQTLTPAEIMSYFGTGENKIFEIVLGAEKAAPAYKEALAYMDSNMGRFPLHPGVADLMDNLKTAGVPIAIFTGRSWDSTEMILKHHKILDRFVTVVANDHVNQSKPSPEGLHLATGRMNLEAKDVFFVGDSPMDMIASKAAGSRGVGALWDLLAERALLEAHDPHHLADHPDHIWEVWQQIQS